MQYADKPILEKELGELTNDNTDDKEIRGLAFDNPPYYASIEADKNNQVIVVFVGYPNKTSNTKFITSRNIGSNASFSDVTNVYGNNYYKKTHRNFMGSGEGYEITYKDKEHNTAIEFGFNQVDPYSDSKEVSLSYIRLNKL